MRSRLDEVKYRLPDDLREELKRPIGLLLEEEKLIAEVRKRRILVSVGDMVTFTLLRRDIEPRIAIIDYKCKRKACSEEVRDLLQGFGEVKIQVKNPASTITYELWDAVEKAYKICKEKTVCIVVDGEEDMASLVAIVLAPPAGTVIYGLPNKGIILVDVTDKEKNMVRKVLKRCIHGNRDR